MRALLDAAGDREGWEKSGEVAVNEMNSPSHMAVRFGRVEIVQMLCSEKQRPRVMV